MRDWIFSFLYLVSFFAFSQNSKEFLEKRKSQLQEDINIANVLLKKTQKDKALTLNQVRALDKKVKARKELIKTIQQQVRNSEIQISRMKKEILKNQKDIDLLKKEYASMIREAQKRGKPTQSWAYVFASSSIQQALKRIYFLKQYVGFRRTQVDEINSLKERKEKNIALEEKEKEEKIKLLSEEIAQKQVLINDKNDRERAAQSLKRKESRVLAEIKKKRSELQKLERQIQKIIKQELKRQRNAARKSSSNSKSTNSNLATFELTPEGTALAKNFSENKGNLPWPVKRGIITQDFGPNIVPGTSGVSIKNPGIDIGTPKGSMVRAVFRGEVSTVVRIPGANRVVLIRHGNYFTVYSNLEDVYVKTGDKVDILEEIGSVASDPETGESTVHFELWKNTENQDPKPWLNR
jgi:septal ring factor EnvC (AmiA/AmiB activator)